jgi:hypothetical protein
MDGRMKIANTVRPLIAALLVSGIAPSLGRAYVDVELDGGRHVIGQYYTADGAKLTVYRPSGAIEVDRASARAITEKPGDMPAEVRSGADVPPTTASNAVSAKSAPAIAAPAKDPAERDRQLGHQLIHMRLNRLAALQRGDDEAMKKLDGQINTLQGEWQANWKKLHPSDGKGSND